MLCFVGEIHSLSFEEIQKWKEHVKRHGIIQFCNWYNKVKDINYDTLKWGDEVNKQFWVFHRVCVTDLQTAEPGEGVLL